MAPVLPWGMTVRDSRDEGTFRRDEGCAPPGVPWIITSSQRGGTWMLRRLGTALAVVTLFAGGSAFAQELIPINFQSKWFPQAQFAGYFVAQEKGFYAEEGLDVTILDGGNVNPTVQVG